MQEQDAGLGAGMRLESVGMQSHYGQDAGPFRNKIPDIFIRGVVEPALRQHDSHTAAGLEKVQVALDKEDVPADAVAIPGQVVPAQDPAFADLSGKGRISHQQVKVEPVVLARFGPQFLQALVAPGISADPIAVSLHSILPALVVQGIQVQHIGFPVPGNQVQGAGHAHRLFVKVNAENPQGVRFILGGDAGIGEQLAGKLENGMHRKATAAGGGVNHILAALGIEHPDAHINDMTGGKELPLFPLGRLVDQILKGFIHHQQVGIEQLDILQAGDADRQMAVGKLKDGMGRKDARPLLHSLPEQGLNLGFQFGVGLAGVAELHHPKAFAGNRRHGLDKGIVIPAVAIKGAGFGYPGAGSLSHITIEELLVVPAAELIVEFGKDQLEHFLKDIHPGVSQHLILHFQDDVFQGFAVVGDFILED